jgi:hypothetical protein
MLLEEGADEPGVLTPDNDYSKAVVASASLDHTVRVWQLHLTE